jgi:hypothetical protein
MGVYDFNIPRYNIDGVIDALRKELQSIVINSQTSIDEIKQRIADDEVILNRLKDAVNNLPDYSAQYNELYEEMARIKIALQDLIDHPIVLEDIQVGLSTEVQKINGQYLYANHAVSAINDFSGRNIVDTYATKDELSAYISGAFNEISAVSSELTGIIDEKYEEISATIDTVSANFDNIFDNLDYKIDQETERASEIEQTIVDNLTGEISRAQTREAELDEKIDNEKDRATDAEAILSQSITDETTRALTTENALSAGLTAEVSRSTNRDNLLWQNIDTLSNSLNEKESELNNKIDAENERATMAENELLTSLNSEIERTTGIESGLRTDLDNEISRATESETTIQTTLQENIDNEVTRATNAENTLQSNIDSEATLREFADNAIQTNLSNEITRATGVEDGLKSDLTAETTRATNAETTLTNNLTAEISNRETADRDLQSQIQSQIDTIEATQNVVDIVGTYAELEVYDTTHLKDNDKIQVLQDETVGGSTIYKWDESKWTLIGEFGPYYTTSETDNLLSEKQNNLTAGDGIDITNDVVSHSIKVIENNNEEDTVEGTVFTVYLKNNHYKVITISKTITEIIFMIEKSATGILQETGFEFTVPEDSDLETLTFKVIDDNNKKIYTIIPDSYSSPNIYQGTIVNYRCTIGEYEVED